MDAGSPPSRCWFHCTPWGEGEQAVLDYLARYVFRVAITNTRIVGLDDQAVTIRHKGKRWWVRLHEKGGEQHEMPAHHLLEHYLDAYITAAGIGADKTSPLFRTLGGRGRKQVGSLRMARQDARRMIVRRALAAGIITKLGCHTFRATGITVYLLNGGLLEYAQQMAAHESARTTKLYDRRNDQVTLDQVERIVL